MVATKEKAKTAKPGKNAKEEKTIDESFEPIKVDARNANTVVLMLESPEEEVLQKACESLFKFCEKSDGNKLAVHELGATPKIYSLINHEDRVIQRNSTMVFGLLSAHSEVRKYLRQNPVFIEKMISLLSSDYDSLTNEYAALWLKNMSEDYSTKTVMASSTGAMSSLITMLNAKDPDAVYNALSCIDKLMADYQPRQQIKDLRGIEPILNLIKSEYPQIQESVFSALKKITQNAENREAFREIGGVEKLIDFLGCPEYKDLHVNCIGVLSNCLEDTQCLDLVQQSGGLNKLLTFCQDSNEETEMSLVNAAAAKALARSARKPENRKILNEQYAEKILIYLLLSDNDETKACAAHALSVMAESTFCQDAIRNYEGIETLIRLLSAENPKVREYSCLAISNLTFKNTNNWRNILSFQGIESIVNLLKDEKDTTKAYACISLINMSADEVVREEVAQHSLCQSILPALNSTNTFTQAKACLVIASYCVDAVIRNELRLYGVIPIVASLIKSNNDDVRFNSCWAITNSASDLSIAVEYCKNGAIEALREINQSEQRKSSFTEAALKKLLEANLSAKYALKNYLETTDSISDGFYDMGPMRPNGKFYTLDELSQMPVNDKRPIIIVYTTEEKPTTPSESKLETLPKNKSKLGSGTKRDKEKDRDNSGKSRKDKVDHKKSTEELHRTASLANINAVADDRNKESAFIKEQFIYGMEIYKPLIDKDLKLYIDQIKDLFQYLPLREQVVNLARFVSDKMGGSMNRDDIANMGYELLINETKYELKSNIIPIGRIRLGTFYHRALLFKVLADKLCIRSTLERGDYNRAWNTVALKEENGSVKYYLIDLIFEPGKLMIVNSLDAIQYVKL
ncbi:unnamed protein product [Brachionus calyciflorus]|uniref:EDR1/CTR1/ARMC3-like peptidase-like domain-containing protein n=1 Tax=Brachionus calyciflorus TaxID=104777 RepID=A0A813SPI9_9BILA|nr:unnamed protein product [Brachionus calyciflorus]